MELLGFVHCLGNSVPVFALSCERVCHPERYTKPGYRAVV
jgi:hypothetical protein